MQSVKDTPSSFNMSVGKEPATACERVNELVSGNPVVIFAVKGCCICHSVKQLLFGLGVGPAIVELTSDVSEPDTNEAVFRRIPRGTHCYQRYPVVFIGGKCVGGTEAILVHHISGELVPLLKDAGALWL